MTVCVLTNEAGVIRGEVGSIRFINNHDGNIHGRSRGGIARSVGVVRSMGVVRSVGVVGPATGS